jgi:hypothetical protein
MPAPVLPPDEVVQPMPCPPERRAAVRFACLRECIVRPELGTGALEDWWSGMAYNLSVSGIGIGLLYPLPQGTIVQIEPRGWRGARGMRARVVRSTLESYVWFHGCEFLQPLTEDELRAWLQTPSEAVPPLEWLEEGA